MTHTPGPWRTENGSIIANDAGETKKIARAMKHYFPDRKSTIPNWEANAKLMAKAPELLDALENLVASLHLSTKELHPHVERAHSLLRSLK